MTLNITFLGTGYVGLVSGTCFAELGFNVTCMDIDQGKIDALNLRGEIPIYEPGLEELVKKNVAAGRLKFTTNLADCVPQSDAIFIAVGTPQGDDGRANLKYVWAAAEDIAKNLGRYSVVICKSTVPVGTNRKVAEIIAKTNPQAEFDVASNPEFLREGAAIEDFLENPDRVVVGTANPRAAELMDKLYKPLTDRNVPLLHTGLEAAELIKYGANAFLAAKITFINEMALLCEKVGADVLDVAKGMGLDSRVGSKFLQPGPGYGGSCFPKDTNAMAAIGQDFGAPQTLVETTIKTNQAIKNRMVDKIEAACGGSVKGKTIAALGLAFKAQTDDMRDGPALTILPELVKRGAVVQAFDPEAMENAKTMMPMLNYCDNTAAALNGANVAVILTEWADFRALDLAALSNTLSDQTLIDLRNLYNPADAKAAGLNYIGVGR